MNGFHRSAILLVVFAFTPAVRAQDGDLLVIRSLPLDNPSAGAAISKYGVTREDFRRLIETLPTIRKAVPLRIMPAEARVADASIDVELVGTTGEFLDLAESKITIGRFLSTKDIVTRESTAVISASLVRTLFHDQPPLGKSIRIDANYFTVVGVVSDREREGQEAEGPRAAPQILVPLSTMQARFGDIVTLRAEGQIALENYELSQIVLQFDHPRVAVESQEMVERILRTTHDRDDFKVVRPDRWLISR